MSFTRGDTTVGGTGETFTDAIDRIDLELDDLDSRLDVVEVSGPHSHTNKAVLDLITDAGSTAIITLAERSKLSLIEAGATADQTDTEIKTAYENNADTNAFTDANVIQLARPYAIVQVSDGTQALAFTVTTLFNVDTTAGDAVLTLPAAQDGAVITFKKSDNSSNVITINPDGSETIDDDSLLEITGSDKPSRTLVGITGTGWVVI